MGLKDITFNQAEKGKYVSGPIQVNQESVGLQLEFEKGSTLQFFISYDSENFQSVETRTCGEVFARPVIGLKKGQYTATLYANKSEVAAELTFELRSKAGSSTGKAGIL